MFFVCSERGLEVLDFVVFRFVWNGGFYRGFFVEGVFCVRLLFVVWRVRVFLV